MAAEHGLGCEILERAQIEALKMGAYMGVAQGSKPGEGDPRFIHLTYTPKVTLLLQEVSCPFVSLSKLFA